MNERTALRWTVIWVSSSLLFNCFIWFYYHATAGLAVADTQALDFFTGYLIEKLLSVENLFAFYIVFKEFQIPLPLQKRVFNYGIWGAIIMRLILIVVGLWLIERFHWLLYVMGLFLFVTGVKMFFVVESKKINFNDNLIIRCVKKLFRVTPEMQGSRFFIKKNGLLYATPLFIALIFIEVSDLVFAVDSIPAIFAITQDPFIVWTSNVFAILGLRSLYFLLSGMLARFHLLKYGVALILVYIGCKMMVEPWISIPVIVSLIVIAMVLVVFVILSMKLKSKK